MRSHFKDDAEQIFGSWVLAILLLVALAGLSLVAEDDALAAKLPDFVAGDVIQDVGVSDVDVADLGVEL